MKEVITIGVDLAKNVFQVHGVDADGAVIVRRQLRRAQMLTFFKKHPPCLVGMEACATSHHWARQLIGLGHEVKLMAPRSIPLADIVRVELLQLLRKQEKQDVRTRLRNRRSR